MNYNFQVGNWLVHYWYGLCIANFQTVANLGTGLFTTGMAYALQISQLGNFFSIQFNSSITGNWFQIRGNRLK